LTDILQKRMNNYEYSSDENVSTNQGLIFQLCTELSTVSTEQDARTELFKIRQNAVNNEQEAATLSSRQLNKYFWQIKRNGMSFVV